MRTLTLLAFAALVLPSVTLHVAEAEVLANPVASTETSSKLLDENTKSPVARQYAIEGKFIRSERTFLGNKTTKTLGSSRIVFTENRPAKITSVKQTPYVTSIEIIKGTLAVANQPIITVFDEGHTVEVKITAVDDEYVHLDTQVSLQRIDRVEEDAIGKNTTTQAPVHNNFTQRVVRTARLGEILQQEIPAFGNEKPMTFEYTITELKATEKNRF